MSKSDLQSRLTAVLGVLFATGIAAAYSSAWVVLAGIIGAAAIVFSALPADQDSTQSKTTE